MPKYHESYGQVCQGPFNFPMLEKQARELDDLLEKDHDYEYFRLNGNHDYFKAGERADVSVITDDSIDRDGEVMDLKTIDFSPLEETRLVAFNHNYEIPPVAKNIWIKRVNNRFIAKSIYPSKPDNFPINKEFFPDTLFHLIKEGFLPGKSIGGIGKKVTPTQEEIAERPELAKVKAIRKNSRIYEYSVVTLNCNKNAIVEAVTKGIIHTGEELIDEFPELRDIQKKIENNEPLIKSYTSSDDYVAGIKGHIIKELGDLRNEAPVIVENIIARMMGKV